MRCAQDARNHARSKRQRFDLFDVALPHDIRETDKVRLPVVQRDIGIVGVKNVTQLLADFTRNIGGVTLFVDDKANLV